MKSIFLFCAVFFAGAPLFSQKPAIDTSVFGKWSYDYNVKASSDGKYVTYYLRTPNGDSQVFASTGSNWKASFPGTAGADMLSDNKFAVLRTTDDSLYLLQLGTGQREYIGLAVFYALLKDKGNHEWLTYQEPGENKRFVVREMSTGKVQTENHVAWYSFNETGGILLLRMSNGQGSEAGESLRIWNLSTGEKKMLWEGQGLDKYVSDETGRQIAFLTDQEGRYTLWYFRTGMARAEPWVSDTTKGIDSNQLIVNENPVFSRDGKSIFFQLKDKPARVADPGAVRVDIWTYRDLRLQEDQLQKRLPRRYTAAVLTDEKQVHRLQLEDEDLNFGLDLQNCKQYLLVTKNGDNIDFWWQPSARSSVYLESVRDGSRVLLKEKVPYAHDWFQSLNFSISPGGKYVVYYDPFENNYFSYEIASKITRNITLGVDARWKGHGNLWADPVCSAPEGIAGWLEKDAAVLIYDAFDIWKIDPSGNKRPSDVTQGYGLAHHTRLRLTGNPRYQKPLVPGADLLLRAFDTANKYSGFYSKSLDRPGNPLLLTMGPYVYNDPVKVEKSGIWVVQRQSAVEAPNYFFTRNWKSFTAITDLQPQRTYNWLTAELVKWTLPDSSQEQGILYKPENFDVHKKYPLLIHYYEERSQELYKFRTPDVTKAEINIPYFVSRGYLVLVPDIHYKLGAPGESVVNTVVSAARYLCRNSWIDSTRMGIQGHSFGGWETNYLVTHTHLFAAAAEGAGVTDLISSYGELSRGQSRQYGYEIYQGRIRKSLWQEPGLYIDGSPIFRADQVTTPLLMMHNKRDEAVPWAQAVEFFTGLRRLGKKVWMLQYDEGEHFVDGKDAMDYTIRMTQFFDYYLMGQAAPKWMTEGVPASRKGIDTGYELDEKNKIP